MKHFILLLLILFALPVSGVSEASDSPMPTPAPEAVKLVEAVYELRYTPKASCQQAILSVYDNGTSEMIIHFTNVSGGGNYKPPEGAFLRLTKVDGAEGNYGQEPVVIVSRGAQKRTQLSAVISFDRAFGKAENITVSYCRSDGKELYPLKFKLKKFDSSDGKWPEPESTPPVPSIPPVMPTPTPTPRPTLVPGTTEPPQDAALFTATFELRERTANFTDKGATLRVYDDMSTLTMQFKYTKEIADGTVMRMTLVDGKMGYFGEGPIVTLPDGTMQVTIMFNQQVGRIDYFNLEAFAPGSQNRSFKAFYKLRSRAPAGWSELDPIATVPPAATPTPTPLPADVTPTPVPTAPPASKATSQARYALMDPVKYFSLKSATHSRFENGLSVLKIQFRYSGELPATALLRVTQAEYLVGHFGEAVIDQSNDNLLTATIVTDQLQGRLQAFRLRCYDEKGNEQFFADFYASIAGPLWSGGTEASIARSILPTTTPEPPENTPEPTLTVAPTPDPAASATPAPTEPPYNTARSKRRFQPMDKVKYYADYNTTLRRYQEFDVLTVIFRYSGELPEGAVLRLTQADTLIDSYGEAPILPANLENARKDLLSAKIVSDRIPLNCKGLRLKAFAPDGSELFTADYITDTDGISLKEVRSLLNGQPTPSPAASDAPSPAPEDSPVPEPATTTE